MYEEDRLRALDLYKGIFDEVENDTEVLQLLVSPTRQAVNLARSYNAKERKLQVHTQSRAGEHIADEDEPAFIKVIEEIRTQAEALGIAVPKTNDDQISLFEEPDVAETVFDDLDLDSVPETGDEELLPPEEIPGAISLFPDEDRADAAPAPTPAPLPVEPLPADSAAETPADNYAETPAEAPAEEAPAAEAEEVSDAVDAFLADFSIKNDELAPEEGEPKPPVPAVEDFPADEEIAAREAAAPQPQPAAFVLDTAPVAAAAPAAFQFTPAEKAASAEPHAPSAPVPAAPVSAPAEEAAPVQKKANVPLLILFILLAIPVCLLLIGLLLALAAACVCLAAGLLFTGFNGLTAAFTSFSVFADILLVFGAALVLSAVGLLFFWLFLRLLFSGIPGVVRGALALGRKWCYKEVAQV